jgi:hypothetical protein
MSLKRDMSHLLAILITHEGGFPLAWIILDLSLKHTFL